MMDFEFALHNEQARIELDGKWRNVHEWFARGIMCEFNAISLLAQCSHLAIDGAWA